MSELKPCPLCGSTKISAWATTPTVACDHCGATAYDAEAWNTRADDKRVEELEAEAERLKAETVSVRLMLQDWCQFGKGSIYNTELGTELSSGSLHSGTTSDAEISAECMDEIRAAYHETGAFPVFAVVPVERKADS